MIPKPSARSCLVLVVDDDALLRAVASDLLEDAGFEVMEAQSADEAWTILERSSRIGVLFTDIDMPGTMDGLVLAGRVAERWPDVRLVVTSGRNAYRDSDMPDHGRFVAKPYRQRQLVQAIVAAA